MKDIFVWFIGTIRISERETAFWVTFPDEKERTMVFTEDLELALRLHQAIDLEPISVELIASMHSIGFSLINDTSKREVFYGGIVSGEPNWKWRRLSGKSKRWINFKGIVPTKFCTWYDC